MTGKWEAGETASFKKVDDNYRQMTVGGKMGFVMSSRVTLEFGLSWYQSNASNLITEYDDVGVRDTADFTQNALMTRFRVRFYLSR